MGRNIYRLSTSTDWIEHRGIDRFPKKNCVEIDIECVNMFESRIDRSCGTDLAFIGLYMTIPQCEPVCCIVLLEVVHGYRCNRLTWQDIDIVFLQQGNFRLHGR